MNSKCTYVSIKNASCYEQGLVLVLFFLMKIKNLLNAIWSVVICQEFFIWNFCFRKIKRILNFLADSHLFYIQIFEVIINQESLFISSEPQVALLGVFWVALMFQELFRPRIINNNLLSNIYYINYWKKHV